jgi:hypothetical protein
MNPYGQRWAPWSWAFIWSLILWAILLGGLAAVLGGCAAFGAKHTIELSKSGPPVPPPTTHPECKDAASLNCCCDMSVKGIMTCRCPHPGGVPP